MYSRSRHGEKSTVPRRPRQARAGRERKPRQPLAPVERLRPDPFDAGRDHEVAGQVPADPERGVAELLEPRRQRERVRGADASGERARPERADGRRNREGLEASVARMDEARPDRGGRETRVAFDVRKRVERPVALRRRRTNLPQDDSAGMGGVFLVDDRHSVARERPVAVAVNARHPGGPDGNRGGSRQDGRRKQEGRVVVHAPQVWRFFSRKASAEDARKPLTWSALQVVGYAASNDARRCNLPGTPRVDRANHPTAEPPNHLTT